MIEIRLIEAAKADLIDVWSTTFETWGADQADTYLDDIDRALNGLAENPLLGSDCSDIVQGVRRLITGRHVAFYQVSDDTIFVIRVLHQSMDMKRQLRGV
ncbi:MAG: toxin, ParE-ParD toxin-antitoxin system [Marinosulfonomonas sp.]|nr:MAG: toxin, ParE-ParD toxin-antitoxin system [Marinosulfonomonas sp.]